ncbi:hypothetical protein [Kitasatospora sp. NPDC057198]|uniref:hypothetical protein n=1 Tax=Kitasatospora sp. NPDC057198 TaxID=3346046 RepID=UPI003632EFCC
MVRLLPAVSEPWRTRPAAGCGATPGRPRGPARPTRCRSGRTAGSTGAEVVAGLVETHGRARTAELLEGLESVPRRTAAHRGAESTGRDLDAGPARSPAFVLVVDGLARTSVPGLRDAKRWQDVGSRRRPGACASTYRSRCRWSGRRRAAGAGAGQPGGERRQARSARVTRPGEGGSAGVHRTGRTAGGRPRPRRPRGGPAAARGFVEAMDGTVTVGPRTPPAAD